MMMFMFNLLMLLAEVISVTINELQAEAAFPSLMAQVLECKSFKSVSENPPFVILCEEVSEFPQLKNVLTESPHLETPKTPDFTSGLVFSSQSPKPVLESKRGLHTPDDTLDHGHSSKKSITANDLHYLESRCSKLYHKFMLLKVASAENPKELESEFPILKEEHDQLIAEYKRIKSLGAVLSPVVEKRFQDLKVLFTMLNLNYVMRLKGCSNQLGLIINPDQNNKQDVRKTRLSFFVDKLEEFGAIMIESYDEKGQPRVSDAGFETEVAAIRSKFHRLKSECQSFISENTILSRIFEEDVSAIESKLHDLAVSTRLKRVFSSSPSHNLDVENMIGIEAQEVSSDDDKEAKNRLRAWVSQISTLYATNPQENEDMVVGLFQKWRTDLHETCHRIFREMTAFNLPDSEGKNYVEDLMAEITHELSRKTNSVLLVATTICSDGLYQDGVSLDAFYALYQIVQSDISFVKSKLEEISEDLREILQDHAITETSESWSRKNIQKALLQRLDAYLESVEWRNIPDGDECNKLRTESFIVLARLEQLFSDSSVEKRRLYTSVKDNQLPTTRPTPQFTGQRRILRSY